MLAKAPAGASSGDNGSGTGSTGSGDGGTGTGSDRDSGPPGNGDAVGRADRERRLRHGHDLVGLDQPTPDRPQRLRHGAQRAGDGSGGELADKPRLRRRAPPPRRAAAPSSKRPAPASAPSERKRKGFVRTLTNGIGDATRGTAEAVNPTSAASSSRSRFS